MLHNNNKNARAASHGIRRRREHSRQFKTTENSSCAFRRPRTPPLRTNVYSFHQWTRRQCGHLPGPVDSTLVARPVITDAQVWRRDLGTDVLLVERLSTIRRFPYHCRRDGWSHCAHLPLPAEALPEGIRKKARNPTSENLCSYFFFLTIRFHPVNFPSQSVLFTYARFNMIIIKTRAHE